MGFIGILILVSLPVNNATLRIDCINRLRMKGMDREPRYIDGRFFVFALYSR